MQRLLTQSAEIGAKAGVKGGLAEAAKKSGFWAGLRAESPKTVLGLISLAVVAVVGIAYGVAAKKYGLPPSAGVANGAIPVAPSSSPIDNAPPPSPNEVPRE